jgi:hypothetical protein
MPKFIMKTIVIPGNYNQGLDWVERDMKKRWNNGDTDVSTFDYNIVSSADQLLGIRNPHGVFVGTWRERDDIKEIVAYLFKQSDHVNFDLNRVWNSL